MTWVDKTPDEILADLNGILGQLPEMPDPMTIIVNPCHLALIESWQLYWRLRDAGVNWRRAKRLRRRDWERRKKSLYTYDKSAYSSVVVRRMT